MSFYIEIKALEEYSKFLSKYIANVTSLAENMRKDTRRAEEVWKDAVYERTLETILEMERMFKKFDDDVKLMIKTLKVMNEKFSDYVG